jgi:MYXO-CTERM domain-containing protein
LKLAFAKREPARLASFLRTDATELGITATGAPVSPANPGAATASVDAAAPVVDAAASTPTTPDAPAKGGCAACSAGPSSSTSEVAFGLGAVAFLGALMRRPRKGDRR